MPIRANSQGGLRGTAGKQGGAWCHKHYEKKSDSGRGSSQVGGFCFRGQVRYGDMQLYLETSRHFKIAISVKCEQKPDWRRMRSCWQQCYTKWFLEVLLRRGTKKWDSVGTGMWDRLQAGVHADERERLRKVGCGLRAGNGEAPGQLLHFFFTEISSKVTGWREVEVGGGGAFQVSVGL